ncbi:adenosylcobinamide-GDP ribazoletransferase [Hymenobacter oligotrophus]|uniref:Adenosylcobinamide-GDP ribazoletransferase n=1 Tax=Hymenobacter oligotrophus TaxID=2319843 RepID=A0A3B7QW68_9BACT|nr:adenosylcobinamide-GDP ribazoletransferase [Hymenobacter oligotrophus]AYA35765.1 adenosylcobinamide-GDP ribazoletransferase [Hymenobacter oligotrophus]
MKQWLRTQVELLLTAVMFYTRIPCPGWIGHSEELLNRSTIYFPLIGWLVGAASAVVYLGAAYLWGSAIGLLLSMVASVLITGAFHEDGFADVCDGFGGGWTSGRILEIMKDSRVGTYGVVGLGLLMATKFGALYQVGGAESAVKASIPVLLLVAHPLSRLTALSFVFTHQYARENDDAKAKPVAKALDLGRLLTASAWGLLPLLAWVAYAQNPGMLLVLLPLAILQIVLGRWFQRWIGGYTGDCLGATQQLAEVLIYLFFTARIWF